MKNAKSLNLSSFIFAAFCIVPLLAFTSIFSEGIRMPLDQTMSIEFPDQPLEQDANGVKLYFVRSQEAVYLAFFMDHKNQAEQNTISDTYAFYLGMMDSMIRNAKATLTDSSSFSVGRHKGIEFSYTSVEPDGG